MNYFKGFLYSAIITVVILILVWFVLPLALPQSVTERIPFKFNETAIAGLITFAETATPGKLIKSTDWNSAFDRIYNEFNGNINNANIQAAAGIVDTKLATISTANKVNSSALLGTLWSTLTAFDGTIDNADTLHSHSFSALTGTTTFASLSGSISAAQHGDLSASTATMHSATSVAWDSTTVGDALVDHESRITALEGGGGTGTTSMGFYAAATNTAVVVPPNTFSTFMIVHWSAYLTGSPDSYCILTYTGSANPNCLLDTGRCIFNGITTGGVAGSEQTMAGNTAYITSSKGWTPTATTTFDVSGSGCNSVYGIIVTGS